MSDPEFWAAVKEIAAIRKRERIAKVPALLEELRLRYSIHSFTEFHHRVENKVDWWPSTGYWRSLDFKKCGYGLFSLTKYLKENP